MSGRKGLICEKCGHQNRGKSRRHNQQEDSSEQQLSLEVQRAIGGAPWLPVQVEFRHLGFWITNSEGRHLSTDDPACGRNSVMLAPNCLLAIYKVALRHYLLSLGIISPQEIDNQNLIPHVVVRKNEKDSKSSFHSVQGEKFLIMAEDLSSKSDFLIAELDRVRDLHITLFYSKGIKKRVDLLESFKKVLQILNTYPELIGKYAALEGYGEKEIEYWFRNVESYPFQINRPSDWSPVKPPPKKEYRVSSAGSLLDL